MKRIALGLALLLASLAALAATGELQAVDVSSQPVPGLFSPNDTRMAIHFAMVSTDRPLASYVQKCYFTAARKYPVGSVEGYQAVAFCAEVDMAGIILNQSAPESGLPAMRDAYFANGKAENRIGTELIALAGLNTMQAYMTVNWMKSAMTPWVKEAAAKYGRRSTMPQ